MIRRFNFTERKRIEEERVQIEVLDSRSVGPSSFIATLNFDGMELPPDAPVTIEAYRGRAAIRFRWGTVGMPRPPLDRLLANMPDNPSFRVKVVAPDGSGTLLAMANRIRPKREEHHGSLIWLEARDDLGKEVWNLDFGEGNPTLRINKDIPGIESAVQGDNAFRGLVMPEVLRAVLVRALIVDDEDMEDAGDWNDLLAFVRSFHDTPLVTNSGDDEHSVRMTWIDAAVAAFTQKHFRASDLYAAALRGR
ncbi:MAG: hypothetical protein F4X64_03055 [Chloroflexi bacterium]|nr:hypothetical protein [Chloroflexota bacterium]